MAKQKTKAKANPRVAAKTIALVTNINNFITSNKAAFTAGNVMNEAQFLSLASQISGLNCPQLTTIFNTSSEVTKYNLRKLDVYTKLNKVLMHRGIVIKARDYYSSFEIVDKSRVQHEVERMSSRAVITARASNILRIGANTFNSKFTKLKSSEILRVSAHITRGI